MALLAAGNTVLAAAMRQWQREAGRQPPTKNGWMREDGKLPPNGAANAATSAKAGGRGKAADKDCHEGLQTGYRLPSGT
ncbi:MAG: hypothetical protein J0L63_14935 [Anaerolineae bacterium]|nr:hypothetical protein [Anaerolineae bacterium]